jgi:hypothetical protein
MKYRVADSATERLQLWNGRRFVKKAVMKKEKSTRRQKSGMKDDG